MRKNSEVDVSPTSTCLRCGTHFVCGAVAGLERCWCMERPPLGLIPDPADKCYCPACLDELAREAAD